MADAGLGNPKIAKRKPPRKMAAAKKTNREFTGLDRNRRIMRLLSV
jgi:hypothetical protein